MGSGQAASAILVLQVLVLVLVLVVAMHGRAHVPWYPEPVPFGQKHEFFNKKKKPFITFDSLVSGVSVLSQGRNPYLNDFNFARAKMSGTCA